MKRRKMMKEKVKEIISCIIFILLFAWLGISFLTQEQNGHYEQYTSKADSETHYIYVEEECKRVKQKVITQILSTWVISHQ